MPRLIDADALERDIRKDAYCLYEADDAIAFVRDAPTIDAEPVRHGHWTKVKLLYHKIRIAYQCSECGAYGYYHSDKYCNRCGAKMDEEKEGES